MYSEAARNATTGLFHATLFIEFDVIGPGHMVQTFDFD